MRIGKLLPLLLCVWCTAATPASVEAVPTVIVDIHAVGADRVAALKAASSEGVQWSAEFGNELLLGITPAHLDHWLARAGVRAGPPRLALEEIVVRDHACLVHDLEPSLAVVGGTEVLRKPPLLARMTAGPRVPGEPLPPDGVLRRELANDPALLAHAKAQRSIDPQVAALVARIDAERWHTTMATLAGFNRNSFSPSLLGAHDWILARFAEAGLQTSSFGYTFTSSSCPGTPDLANPVGIKVGTVTPNDWVVIGAHYDSRNGLRCDGVASPSPGANDNASGCAGVIELARAFASIETERTMVFTCFSGEEQGLIGSQAYVSALRASGSLPRIKHMLNMDMIGHANSDTLPTRLETSPIHQALFSTYIAAAVDHAPELSLILSTSVAANSDHWSFLSQGVPTMDTWENGATGYYPQYHSFNDLPIFMLRARAQAGGILKMDAAALAGIAQLQEHVASGWYWNASEGGRGYFFERKPGGSVFMAGFLYAANGRPTWFTAQGTLADGATTFSAPMNTFRGGQTLTGSYRAPTATPDLGTLSLDFSDRDSARLTMPGTDIGLERFPFGVGSVLSVPQPLAPQSGWYWNPGEGGRGYAIEFQGDQVFVIAFLYDDAGEPVWVLANGSTTGARRYVGRWLRFGNGQALGQAPRAPELQMPDGGALTIDFSADDRASLTLPDGRVVAIERFGF